MHTAARVQTRRYEHITYPQCIGSQSNFTLNIKSYYWLQSNEYSHTTVQYLCKPLIFIFMTATLIKICRLFSSLSSSKDYRKEQSVSSQSPKLWNSLPISVCLTRIQSLCTSTSELPAFQVSSMNTTYLRTCLNRPDALQLAEFSLLGGAHWCRKWICMNIPETHGTARPSWIPWRPLWIAVTTVSFALGSKSLNIWRLPQ